MFCSEDVALTFIQFWFGRLKSILLLLEVSPASCRSQSQQHHRRRRRKACHNTICNIRKWHSSMSFCFEKAKKEQQHHLNNNNNDARNTSLSCHHHRHHHPSRCKNRNNSPFFHNFCERCFNFNDVNLNVNAVVVFIFDVVFVGGNKRSLHCFTFDFRAKTKWQNCFPYFQIFEKKSLKKLDNLPPGEILKQDVTLNLGNGTPSQPSLALRSGRHFMTFCSRCNRNALIKDFLGH